MRSYAITAMMMLAAAPAAAEQAAASPAPVGRVKGHAVIHSGEQVTVRVPGSAAYLGSERFTLYGVADAEVHVFAESDASRRLRRLYWIQFESYLPSLPDKGYNYADGNRRMEAWGVPTWVRAGPVRTDGPMRAGSDREHVIGILKRAGYTVPDEVMNVRMVQLLDDPEGTGHGRRELMLIYSEDLGPTGEKVADLVVDGKPTARWTPMEQPLVTRATTAFQVERR